MKKTTLLLLVLFSLFSCEEDVKFNNPSIQGMKNNVFWRAVDSRATLLSDGSLLIEAYTANEVLTLKTSSTNVDLYQLGQNNLETAVFLSSKEGNQVMYRTGTDIGAGQIIIEEYDERNKAVTGSFKFNAKNIDAFELVDPILSFQQGVFYKIPVSLQIP